MAVEFSRFAPIFPVSDLARALAHYRSLGFEVDGFDDGDEYGFAERGDAQLHLAVVPGHDPKTTDSAAYLYVSDADALAAEWSAPGIGGDTRTPVHTEYGLREGAHIDPDGNLIRFGSPASPRI